MWIFSIYENVVLELRFLTITSQEMIVMYLKL